MVNPDSVHPSVGQPLRWIVVTAQAQLGRILLEQDVFESTSLSNIDGHAIVLDWMTASYVAPGVKPRLHSTVVRARESRPAGYPPLIVVAASYPRDPAARPSGIEMARTDGRAVGDAIVVARALGLVLETVIVEYRLFELMARNESIEAHIMAREFLSSAGAALK